MNVLLGRQVVAMPALIVLGFWIVLQLVSGVGTIADDEPDVGGVAYMAHVGGFVAGFLMAFLFRGRGSSACRPDGLVRRPRTCLPPRHLTLIA